MDADELEPETSHTSGNGSASTAPQESQTLAMEPSGSGGPADGKATRPRTEQGKQKSSRNATKHGVFSKVAVLKGESRAEYEELLTGLQEDLQPKGALEERLVEVLATLTWRQRRLLLAEGAEIQNSKEAEKFVDAFGPSNNAGLIRKIQSPNVLERCLELLAELRKEVEKDYYTEYCNPILAKIYGLDDKEEHACGNLYDPYREWVRASKSSGEEQGHGGHASLTQYRLNVLYGIDQETRHLRRYQEARTSIETMRTQPEVLRHNVPDAPTLDRLIRYEAHLSREFDKTLAQLERRQRTRLGQPVLPTVEVRHSLS